MRDGVNSCSIHIRVRVSSASISGMHIKAVFEFFSISFFTALAVGIVLFLFSVDWLMFVTIVRLFFI